VIMAKMQRTGGAHAGEHTLWLVGQGSQISLP
jgi:hypothetical protein